MNARGRPIGMTSSAIIATILCCGLGPLVPRPAAAHCDTLDGPAVAAAWIALEKGDVTPVLMWVRLEDTFLVTAEGPRALTHFPVELGDPASLQGERGLEKRRQGA